jgi:uncharacterized protein (TIGR02145 family)
LKSSAGWTNNGDDAYGFGALPGGARYPILGDFYYGGENGQWWSSDGDGGSTAWYRYLTNFNEDLLLGNDNKKLGQSVRCLKDN